MGVPPEDVMLVRLDLIGPSVAQRPLASVVWADLVSQANANARPLARYLVFMIAAGVIAAFGVIYSNVTLVVGAMAISPDTLPITAAATALVLGRWRLTARAVSALLIGLGVVCVVGGGVDIRAESAWTAAGRLRRELDLPGGPRYRQHLDSDRRVRGGSRGDPRARDESQLGGRSGHLGNHNPRLGLSRSRSGHRGGWEGGRRVTGSRRQRRHVDGRRYVDAARTARAESTDRHLKWMMVPSQRAATIAGREHRR